MILIDYVIIKASFCIKFFIREIKKNGKNKKRLQMGIGFEFKV